MIMSLSICPSNLLRAVKIEQHPLMSSKLPEGSVSQGEPSVPKRMTFIEKVERDEKGFLEKCFKPLKVVFFDANSNKIEQTRLKEPNDNTEVQLSNFGKRLKEFGESCPETDTKYISNRVTEQGGKSAS